MPVDTATSHCNLALDQVPAGRITNLTENTVQGRVCALHYAQVLEELLETVAPNHAMTRVALSEVPANDRLAEWSYLYTLPDDVAVVLQISEPNGGSYHWDYEVIGTYLYTNVLDAYVTYISTNTLAGPQSALFRKALMFTLAARICMPLTKDVKRTQWLRQEAELATQRAQAANFNRQPQEYGNHIPDVLRERMGYPFGQRVLEGPDVSYPDADYVSVFEEELGN